METKLEDAEKLFSVVVSHYQQLELWKDTIDSILKQSYPAIQIIFADDHTPGFNIKEVEQYIKQNNCGNVKSIVVFSQKENIGTVKNVNYAHGYCTGYYITHTAADDAYYDENVFYNYANYLEYVPNDVCGIYGKSIKCDIKLNLRDEEFIDSSLAQSYNQLSARKQFKKMLVKCFIPLGAMAFKTKTFKQFMPFDEKYTLIEDWPFFLKVMKAGMRFEFFDFPAMLYRDGGVTSSFSREKNAEAQKKAYKDHLQFYDNELWKYTRMMSYKQLFRMAYKYDYDRHFMKKVLGPIQSRKRITILQKDIRFLGVIIDKWFNQKEFGKGLKNIYRNMALYLFNPYL
nr:glycosyltransferase [uncultured Clostridium sp.]